LAVGEQPASALLGLRLLVSVIPIIGLAIAFLATRAYPLYGERLEQVKAEVEKLHREKGVANP
jgi:GPH family glycoside/pentoside/hexuronide:cation symporter